MDVSPVIKLFFYLSERRYDLASFLFSSVLAIVVSRLLSPMRACGELKVGGTWDMHKSPEEDDHNSCLIMSCKLAFRFKQLCSACD